MEGRCFSVGWPTSEADERCGHALKGEKTVEGKIRIWGRTGSRVIAGKEKMKKHKTTYTGGGVLWAKKTQKEKTPDKPNLLSLNTIRRKEKRKKKIRKRGKRAKNAWAWS